MRYLKLLIWCFVLFACNSKETRLQQLLLKGNQALKAGNYDKASYYFGEAIKVDDCYADAWNNLGTVHFNQKQYLLAQESYQKAMECRRALLMPCLTMPMPATN
ncbi:MAG: tetratricopeptide repeat protein [Cyclobacteriaceae bacterium]|nr:MAG: tetratricopeptide repeat protein [Cyclobacteriaceae bacterium]